MFAICSLALKASDQSPYFQEPRTQIPPWTTPRVSRRRFVQVVLAQAYCAGNS